MKKYTLARLRKSKTLKVVCVFLAVNLVVELLFPVGAYALTAGANSPEFSSFEPVATTDMVNDFTGDFTYNLPVLSIPGPDGGGYSLSLSYHSGVSSEEEASWVGFGWTLNPGAINRQLRGYPDDFKGVPVKKYNKMKPNWTQSSTFDFALELNSSDKKEGEKQGEDNSKSKGMFFNKVADDDEPPFSLENPLSGDDTGGESSDVSVSISKSVRFNNYSGFSISTGFSGAKGMANLQMTRAGGENTLGFSINPMAILMHFYNKKTKQAKAEADKAFQEFQESGDFESFNKAIDKYKIKRNRSSAYRGMGLFSSSYGSWSYNAPAIPYSVAYNVGRSFNFRGSVGINPYGPVGFQVGIAGNFNTQINIPEDSVMAYGYMYNPNYGMMSGIVGKAYHDLGSGDVVIEADYQIEKATTFNKHDKYLGIPHNNADMYSATGNAVVGGFRFHSDKLGHYYPPFVFNKQQIRQLGIELGIGGTIQIGFDLGLGFQNTKVDRWNNISTAPPEFETPGNTLPFLQFTNDMGGALRYSKNDDNLYATIDGLNRELQLDNFTSDNQTELNDGNGQTSYLEYAHYDNNGNLQGRQDMSGPAAGPKNQVAQIAVTNQDGAKTIYGMPVYTRNNMELTVGLDDFNDGKYLVPQEVQYQNPADNATAMGQLIEEKYASTYLITQQTTADYVDANGNQEADDADFGGWTKFHYRKAYGGNNWYRYRAPYNQLFYQKGRLFDKRDQTGSFSSGEKEVCYLESVETKTHVAIFVTNKLTAATIQNIITSKAKAPISAAAAAAMANRIKGSADARFDGLDAQAAGTTDPAANNATAQGSNELEKLEKIVLFSKYNFQEPISITNFEYDYHLCRGLPNSKNIDTDYTQSGKLTLKKVWTESGGAMSSRISPYRFYYEYFQNYPAEVLPKYSDLLVGYDQLTSADQNPSYKPERLDMWGFYQEDGADRFKKMIPWVSQKDIPADFDPAAWQLKRIKLPSGGEIHVQYEQKDYRYVQNEQALAMAPLQDLPDTENGYKSGENRYYINAEDFGVLTAMDAEKYVNQLKRFFIDRKNKLYFKVLYAYTGYPTNLISSMNLERSDYIDGYTTVDDIGYNPGTNEIYFELGERKNNGDGKKDRTLPRYTCYEKLLTAAGKNLGLNASNWEETDDDILNKAYVTGDVINDHNGTLSDISGSNAIPGTFTLFGNWVSGKVRNVKRIDACKELRFDLSYFRVPLPADRAKKGGGIRVKRLLSYDPGIETGDAMVYGTGYLYQMADGRSSGVATNEPQAGREENALVKFLENKPQKKLDKLLNGRNTKFFEGPLGEALLPAASVVHERVVLKNIHSGKSTTGYRISEYHTVRTHPSLSVEHSDISKANDTYRKFNINLPLGLINFSTQKAWVTQGYRFLLNDMHGKPKRQAIYAGNYSPGTFVDAAFISQTTYEYSEPGEPIKTLVYDPATNAFNKEELKLGEEEDLTMFMSGVEDKTNDFALEIDLNITLPCAISLGFGFAYSYAEKGFYQHVTSKVIRQKTYLLSTTTVTDGVAQANRNIAFNKHNGEPVLTQTFDGYTAPQEPIYTELTNQHKGYYYSLNIPASWVKEGMGQKWAQGSNRNQLTASAGNIVTYGQNPLASLPAGSSWTPGAFNDVVSASAVVYELDWFTNYSSFPYLNDVLSSQSSATLAALNQNYYPKRSYVYRDDVSDANDNARIYNGGLIANMEFFNYQNWDYEQPILGANGNWFSASKVQYYSPHGYPLQEEDVLGIKSVARFGYDNMLPILVAQNAELSSVHFIDFEYPIAPIDNTKVMELAAHSGRKAYNLSAGPQQVFLDNVLLNDQLFNKGARVMLWLRSELTANPSSSDYGLKNPNPGLKAVLNNQLFFDFKAIAQTGEWTLYEARIQDWGALSSGDYFNLKLQYNFMGNEEVLLDDFRFQPADAVMNCTVYYEDFQVAAQFDDQHFGVFYELNNERRLVRKSIETERGKKTLQEQEYNTPTVLNY